MPFVYIVRCNFTAPEKEAAWNAWYDGPKIAQMLTLPQFRTCQRFKRATGSGRDYLALWTVQTPDAFETDAYKSQWGFSEWEPFIRDWSRDLFDARAQDDDAFAAMLGGTLQVVSFDGMSVDDALAARATMDPGPDTMWLPVIGLDRHTPLIGLRVQGDRAGASADAAPAPNVQQGVYRPISELHKAAA